MNWLIPVFLATPLVTVVHLPAGSDGSCLQEASVVALDAGWERAYLDRDYGHLEKLLAEDFVWVHTHASQVDSKQDVLRTVSAPGEWNMISREQSDIEVRILDHTAVVIGFNVVTRPGSSTRYAFMRTYVKSGDDCVLLANQTMAIPAAE